MGNYKIPSSAKTLGEIYNVTWNLKWKRSKSYKTQKCNGNHLIDIYGASFPVKNMGKVVFWVQLYNDLIDEKSTLSNSTLNKIVSCGTTMLKYTKSLELHDIKCPHFDRKTEIQYRYAYYTQDEVEQLVFTAVDVFRRKDLADAIVFASYMGPRRDELLKVKVEDVDWNTNVVWFGGRPGRVTKGGECRPVPIAERVIDIIRDRCNDSHSTATLFGRDWLNGPQLSECFFKIKNYCGFSKEHVYHSLRHSYCTWLGQHTHPRTVMALAGHKDINTTLRYCHASDDANREAVAALSSPVPKPITIIEPVIKTPVVLESAEYYDTYAINGMKSDYSFALSTCA